MGCNTSKDAKGPSTKKNPTNKGVNAGSPVKGESNFRSGEIKEIPLKELEKHQP